MSSAHHAGLLRLPRNGGWPRLDAVDDAAASHDPLSSSGIACTLHSGIHVARAIHNFLRTGQPCVPGWLRSMDAESFEHYCATRQRYYGIEQRWPQSLFWNRRRTA
jgi:hypothetical protein